MPITAAHFSAPRETRIMAPVSLPSWKQCCSWGIIGCSNTVRWRLSSFKRDIISTSRRREQSFRPCCVSEIGSNDILRTSFMPLCITLTTCPNPPFDNNFTTLMPCCVRAAPIFKRSSSLILWLPPLLEKPHSFATIVALRRSVGYVR